jgi:hypothetical protein
MQNPVIQTLVLPEAFRYCTAPRTSWPAANPEIEALHHMLGLWKVVIISLLTAIETPEACSRRCQT